MVDDDVTNLVHSRTIAIQTSCQPCWNRTFDLALHGAWLVFIYSFQEGKVFYQFRQLHTEAYKRDMSARRLVVGEFGTGQYADPCKSIFWRYFSYFFEEGMVTDNTSVNLLETGDQLFAMTETPFVNRIDPHTLDVMEKVDLSKIIALNSATAHPHQDLDGTTYNIGTAFGGKSAYKFIKIPPAVPGEANSLEKATLLASVNSKWAASPAYYHSFGMTENYIVFLEQPLAVNGFKLMFSRFLMATYKDALTFYPNEQAVFHVLDKRTGKEIPQKYTTDALFVFHHINAYEEDGHIVVDLSGYDDASVIEKLSLKHLTQDPSGRDFFVTPPPTVRRFVLPLSISQDAALGKNLVALSYTSATALLDDAKEIQCIPQTYDCHLELPRVNYEKYNGHKYSYAYGMDAIGQDLVLTKLDLTTGERKSWQDDPIYLVGEPVFVASPDATTEDDGVVLSPILSSKPEKPSFLVILDAKDMTEIARAIVPTDVKVAMTFHGHYTETFKK